MKREGRREEEWREKRADKKIKKLKEKMKKRTLLSHDSYVSSRAIICNT